MIIIIDGYNLLKSILPAHSVRENERRQFLATLSDYASRKKHDLVVVFDGGPHEWPLKEKIMGMKVIYAGQRQTADAVIKHYVADHYRKELLLVSSDHDLVLHANRHDVPSIGSVDFHVLVQEALSMPEAPAEPEIILSDEADNLDDLMNEASTHAAAKSDDVLFSNRRQRSSAQASRADRVLLQRLKKL